MYRQRDDRSGIDTLEMEQSIPSAHQSSSMPRGKGSPLARCRNDWTSVGQTGRHLRPDVSTYTVCDSSHKSESSRSGTDHETTTKSQSLPKRRAQLDPSGKHPMPGNIPVDWRASNDQTTPFGNSSWIS